MDFDSVRLLLDEINSRFLVIKNALKYDDLVIQLEELEKSTLEPGFWEDSSKQASILPKIKSNKELIEKIDNLLLTTKFTR